MVLFTSIIADWLNCCQIYRVGVQYSFCHRTCTTDGMCGGNDSFCHDRLSARCEKALAVLLEYRMLRNKRMNVYLEVENYLAFIRCGGYIVFANRRLLCEIQYYIVLW